MALAHTCIRCGHDLAGVRASLDPIYQWPIATCPACKVSVVRRSDGHRVVPRHVRRQLQAFRRLVESSVVLLVFSAGFVGTCFILCGTLVDQRLGLWAALFADADENSRAAAWRSQLGHLAFGIWVLMAVGAGAYLTAAATHRQRLRVLALWMIPTVSVLVLPGLVLLIDEIVSRGRRGQAVEWARLVTRNDRFTIRSLVQILGLSLPLLPLGFPAGRIVRRVRDRVARQRFRRLRRRIVNRRQRA